MIPIQNLYYSIGQLAYTIASADGKIQKQEAVRFLDIVTAELDNKNYDFDVSLIIFNMMVKDKTDPQTTYDWAMNNIRINSHYMSPELKLKFIKIMEEISEAFPSVTSEEKNILERFKKDIAPLNGDPVFYEKYKNKLKN